MGRALYDAHPGGPGGVLGYSNPAAAGTRAAAPPLCKRCSLSEHTELEARGAACPGVIRAGLGDAVPTDTAPALLSPPRCNQPWPGPAGAPLQSPAVSPASRSPRAVLTAPAWVPTEGSRSADASIATARDMRSAWIQQFQLISSPILQQFSEPVGCFRLCKRPSHARSHHFPSPLPGGVRTGAGLASSQLQHRCHRPPKPAAPLHHVLAPRRAAAGSGDGSCRTQPCTGAATPTGSPGHLCPQAGPSSTELGSAMGCSACPPASQPTSLTPDPRARPGGAAPLLPPPRTDVLGQPVPAEPRGRVPGASRETWEPQRCQAGSRLEYQVLSCAAGCAASGAELGHPDLRGPTGPAHGRPCQLGELSAALSPPGGSPAQDLADLLLSNLSLFAAGLYHLFSRQHCPPAETALFPPLCLLP